MKKIYSFVFVVAVFFQHANAQPDKMSVSIDSVLAVKFTPDAPGASILVAKGGKIVYRKAVGKADIQLNVSMQPEMIFQLASITKQFTAISILQLMEAGKLKLTDSIQQYLPNYPSAAVPITIEYLLAHVSGIPDYLQLSYTAPNLERWDFSPNELIDSFKHRPLQFTPGTAYRYSNSGYYLLGYIIEKITGTKYQDYVQKNIITPLGLTNTKFDEGNNIIPGRVQGYQVIDKQLLRADYWSPSITYSAGVLLSNTEDLFKWNEALKSYKVVTQETLKKAYTQYKLPDGTAVNYGYGWSISNIDSGVCIYHGGAMNGFLTQESYFPDEDIYIVVLCNSQQAPRDYLAGTIASIARGKTPSSTHKPSETLLASYLGTYQLEGNNKRTITIFQEKGIVGMKISGQQPIAITFVSDTQFQLLNVLDATGIFESTNGKVERMIINQNGKYIWQKIK